MMIADPVRNDGAWQVVMDGGPVTSPCRAERSADGGEAGVSPGGSCECDGIADHCRTPWEPGLGHLVKFDHDFVGRSALENLAGRSQWRKAWLRWNDEDVQRVIASSPFDEPGTEAKYFDSPKSVYSSLPRAQVLIGDRLVGLSTYAGYAVNGGGRLSLAMLDAAVVRDEAEVTVAWAGSGGGSRMPAVERHVQARVRATVSTRRLV